MAVVDGKKSKKEKVHFIKSICIGLLIAGLVVSVNGCAGVKQQRAVGEVIKTERDKIFSILAEDDDKYLLTAIEKQEVKIPFFEIASYLNNYRLTTNDKTIDGFLKSLKDELTGSNKKIGWRADIAEDYVDKIRRDYKFIKQYEKGQK